MDLTFTYDLEDNRPQESLPQRFDIVTRTVLETLGEMKVRGTFFVVATAARKAPELVREISELGHEVGLHSYDHQMLPDQTTAQFEEETRLGRSILQDITGKAVVGYRAPNFSLTRNSLWATDVLGELGFAYSSSVLPVAHPYYGFPGAPTTPFRWPSGLLELPAPVSNFGLKQLPYLGGTYFRVLPQRLLKRKLKAESMDGCWFYAHPHDFDYEESFYRIRDVSWFVTFVLRVRRRGNLQRMQKFLSDDSLTLTPPLRELVEADLFAGVSVFDPVMDPPAKDLRNEA